MSPAKNIRQCAYPGCERDREKGGLCEMHERVRTNLAMMGKAKVEPRWYDFGERLVPYRDVVMLLGGATFVLGCFLIPLWKTRPLGYLVLGVLLVQISRMMAKAK